MKLKYCFLKKKGLVRRISISGKNTNRRAWENLKYRQFMSTTVLAKNLLVVNSDIEGGDIRSSPT